MFFNRLIPILLHLICFISFAQHPKVEKSPLPEWVNLSLPDLEASQSTDDAAGFYYLLVDDQDHLGKKHFYNRRTYKVLSTTGVQEMGDITIDFDPEYQHLQIHNLNIIRNGQVLNKLVLNNVRVVQREVNMERFLYDGSLTAIVNLTDVRVGDIIDYSYSIIGSNPIHEGKYQNTFFLQLNLPIENYRLRFIVPEREQVNYNLFYLAEEPVITKRNGETEYFWERKKLEAFTYESNLPDWYDPTPSLEMSQFNSWKEVVDQYQKHYILDQARRKNLGQKFKNVISSADSEATFIDKSIRFVQDDVRYLGFENGLNSHKPSNPIEVLERRYGDCKDKSFLLSEILQSAGIKAYPMLVHSSKGKNLINSLPSVGIFDHCVVQVELENGELKYIDPTINGQGGTVENLYFPDYGYGLVLKPGEVGLTKLPQPETPQTKITQTFEIPEIGGGAKLDVETIYKGSSADHHRRRFEESSRQSIQQDYSSFYSNLYPSITAVKNVSYRDYRDLNEFIVYEQYEVDNFWKPGMENPEVLLAEFYPLELESYLFPDKYTGRKMPLYIDRTLNVKHKTIAYLPESWKIQDEQVNYSTGEFTYDFKVNYDDSKVEIEHSYQNLKDHVAPENLKAYLNEHALAQQNISYSLTYNKQLAGLEGDDSISWLSVIFMLLAMGGAGFFCILIYKNYDLPGRTNSNYQQKIDGWLILVGLGLVASPIIILIEIFGSSGYLLNSSWRYLSASGDNFPLLILYLFGFIYNSAYFIFSLLVVILFYQRRTIAPRLIIWLLAVSFVVTALDAFITFQLLPPEFLETENGNHLSDLAGLAIRCIIWIPYFMFSQRVKDTFTVRRKRDLKPEPIAAPPAISI